MTDRRREEPLKHPVFAYLALKEHPYSRLMLDRLLAAGFVPRILIEEDSEVADVERAKFLERMSGYELPASIAEQVKAHSIEALTMPVHTSPALLEILDPIPLDIIVLGGTRILRGPVLSHPRHGVVNSHPGLLPDCRGSASPAWSVLHDIPIGSTTHFCDEGIDTGDILLRRGVPVKRGMNYEDLCFETSLLAGTLMQEALTAYVEGRWPSLRRPQGTSDRETFKNAPPEVLEIVRQKLKCETYKHYV